MAPARFATHARSILVTILSLLAMGTFLQPTGTHAQTAPIDPKSLQVPTSLFGSMEVLNNSTTDATFADIFDPYHLHSYAGMGFLTGYEEDGYTKATTGEVHLQYVAGVFPSTSAAKAEVEDARAYFAHLGAGSLVRPCSTTPYTVNGISVSNPPECLFFQGEYTDKSTGTASTLVYGNFSVGVCTGAFSLSGPQAELEGSNAPAYNKQFVAFAHSIVAAETAVCGNVQSGTTSAPSSPVSIHISGLALAHKIKGKMLTTHAVRVGEIAIFVATYQITPGATATATMTISRAGKTIRTVTMQSGTLQDGTTYFYYATKFGKKLVGTWHGTITITSGSTTDTQSIQFRVKR